MKCDQPNCDGKMEQGVTLDSYPCVYTYRCLKCGAWQSHEDERQREEFDVQNASTKGGSIVVKK